MLSDRIEALNRTLAKYRNKPFVWGKSDCVKMARDHLVNMGHKPRKIPPYKSAVGARGALKKVGYASLESLFDSMLPRIAPAQMLPGDVALMEGEPPFDALVISLGRKVMGFHSDAKGTVVMVPHEIKAAWRV
jgi:hypothetical protein